MGVSLKKGLRFLREDFDAAFPWSRSWMHAQCAP